MNQGAHSRESGHSTSPPPVDLAGLRAQQLEYERGIGAGANRDPKMESQLAAALGEQGVELKVELDVPALTDRLAEARLQGAREAREAREAELRAYASRHLEALEAELAAGLDAERAAVLTAGRSMAEAMSPLLERESRAGDIRYLAGATNRPEFVEGTYDIYDEILRGLGRLERSAPDDTEAAA